MKRSGHYDQTGRCRGNSVAGRIGIVTTLSQNGRSAGGVGRQAFGSLFELAGELWRHSGGGDAVPCRRQSSLLILFLVPRQFQWIAALSSARGNHGVLRNSASQSGRVSHFREDFTTDYTDCTDGIEKKKVGKLQLFIREIREIRGHFLVAAGRGALFRVIPAITCPPGMPSEATEATETEKLDLWKPPLPARPLHRCVVGREKTENRVRARS